MNPARLDDPGLESRLAALPPDGARIWSLAGGTVRLAVIAGTRAVAEARAAHGAGLLETIALGQALLLAGLYATTLKGGDRASLRLESDGPFRGFSVEAGADGSVRGSLLDAHIPLEAPPPSLDLAPLVGRGSLVVARSVAGAPRPFTGHVALVPGGLARNVAEYFLRSEQTRTALDVGVKPDRSGRPEGAGGVLVQALPGARDEVLEEAERVLAGLPSIGAWFASGGTADGLVERRFAGLEPRPLGERPFRFHCPCGKERFAATLAGLGEGLRELATVGPWPVETTCKACGSTYRFEREELEALLKGGAG